jgi:hypothetical protein
MQADPIWDFIQTEAQQLASEEPLLADFFQRAVLQHKASRRLIGHVLAETFASSSINNDVQSVIAEALKDEPQIGVSIRRDIEAAFQRGCCMSVLFDAFNLFQRVSSHCSYIVFLIGYGLISAFLLRCF